MWRISNAFFFHTPPMLRVLSLVAVLTDPVKVVHRFTPKQLQIRTPPPLILFFFVSALLYMGYRVSPAPILRIKLLAHIRYTRQRKFFLVDI